MTISHFLITAIFIFLGGLGIAVMQASLLRCLQVLKQNSPVKDSGYFATALPQANRKLSWK